LCWDEENRLRLVHGQDDATSYYLYDAGGERGLKLVGKRINMTINGQPVKRFTINEQTLYFDAYLVKDNKGYTKHYYAGSERIFSKIGGGMGKALPSLVSPDRYENKILSNREKLVDYLNGCSPELVDDFSFVMKMKIKKECSSELEYYFYHTDHLGSSSWISDQSGTPVQHLQYLPFGESWINQRNNNFSGAPYTFSGKERDAETGYMYFHDRYYDPDLSIWLSVDRKHYLYPHVSGYVYALNNPLKYIDPNGMEVIIAGDAKAEAFKELQSSTKLKLTMDADGKLDATGKVRKKDELLYEAIKSEDVKVEVTANKANLFEDNGKKYKTEIGGAFMGNTLNRDENGNAVSAETKQFISMDRLNTCFDAKDVGKMIMHEVTESYMGGRISIERNEAATPAYAPKGGGVSPNTIFRDAHRLATPQPRNRPLYSLPPP